MINNSTSIGILGLQSRLHQLPPVINSKPDTKTDNIVHVQFQQRQEVAEIDNTPSQSNNAATVNNRSNDNFEISIADLNNSSQLIERNLEFHVDSSTGRTVITVRNSESKEVIRQIPSQQVLEISGKLKELQASNLEKRGTATGILFTSTS